MGLSINKLPVLELFTSIQGEGRNLGVPYVFLRVGGCPLRCNFCDTEYSWKVNPSQVKDLREVIQDTMDLARKNSIQWISITGGEPLIYPDQLNIMVYAFLQRGFKTHIETSGRYYDSEIHKASTIWSADVKTPCTGEHRSDCQDWLELMRHGDQVKCLIMDETDLDYALDINKRLDGRCAMILQPFNTNIFTESTKNMTPAIKDRMPRITSDPTNRRINLLETYKWLVESVMKNVREWKNIVISLQAHVLIWGNQHAK